MHVTLDESKVRKPIKYQAAQFQLGELLTESGNVPVKSLCCANAERSRDQDKTH